MSGFIFSCKNDIETIQALTTELDMPDFSAYNVEMTQTDSGRLTGKVFAPEVNQFVRKEDPYYEFPAGMRAVFYNRNGEAYSYIEARYAIWYNKRQIWEARNQVVAENQREGKKVETEQMFWDQKEERIYSDKFTRVTNADGVFVGENGFDARQDLSSFRMNGYSGKINITEETAP
ncbi:MAG: LPS export ABC transporter periplasmic protein LptC [Bacteroidales bacterium]|nr:LPS export ABC transporter periplasmic protein LptC [Bacteroidales bacterium]